MTRHPFVHSSPLFLCIFFAYFILALFSCRTFSRAASSCFRFMSHFFVLHSFCVWFYRTFSYGTLFKLHFFHVASCSFVSFLCVSLFSSCIFSRVTLCCTHFMLHLFCVALISCCTFFVLHSFQVSLFLCCTLLMLHFSVSHHFQFSLFLSITFAPFFVLHCFDVVPFVHSFHVALFSCCTVFMLHLLVCCLMPHSVHVALFRYSGQQLY